MKKQKGTTRVWLIVVLMTCTLLLGKSAAAQTSMPDFKNSTPEQRAQFQTQMMTSKLKLDATQATKVQAINLKYAGKMQTIIKNDDSRFSKMRAAKSLQKDKDQELKSVFSPAQFKQYQDFEEEMKAKLMEKIKEKQ